MKNGLVIGKFYPPHNGHKYLIETGLAKVDRLIVIVCDHKSQKIRGALRAKWLKEMVPQAEVMVVDDCLPDDDSKAWAEYTIKILGYAPDFVFSSEDYGQRYADFMGSKHVMVDKARVNVSISATQIRKDPLKYWDYLAPCVRAYFAKRVSIVGAESSGKTILAKKLAEHYKTVWVPEFGRVYSEAKMLSPQTAIWQSDEFVFIAEQQNKIEDQLARVCDKILFCDTDSFATSLWHERYMGFMSQEVQAVSRGRNYDLYLLTDIDVPFVQDGLRDGEHIREDMHNRFKEELIKQNKPYLLLSGDYNGRFKKAIKACDMVLKKIKSI